MRLLLAAMLALLPQVAAAKCMSKAEARAIYASHLYWSVGINGQCWARSMREARAAAKTPQPKPVTQPRQMLPVVVPIAPPPQEETLDDPRWSWVSEARAAEPTFAEMSPLILPAKPTPARQDNGSAFFTVLAFAVALTASWLLFARRFLWRLYPW